MEKRRLGKLKVSLTGLGLAQFGKDKDYPNAERLIHSALDAGINFFDTADIYGHAETGEYHSEEFLGRALVGRRNRALISTKFGYSTEPTSVSNPPFTGLSAAYAEQAVDASLRRLQTDHIDLYQPHTFDPKVPIEETLGALARLVEKGKIREIGSSRFSVDQIVAADKAARAAHGPRFVSTQAALNLLQRAPISRMVPTLDKLDIMLIPFSPLANGFLTGKYRANQPLPAGAILTKAIQTSPTLGGRTLNEKNFMIIEALIKYAADHRHTMVQLAFSWLAAQPRVASVIAGASNPDQVAENAKAATWKMTRTQVAEINAIVASFDASEATDTSR